MLSDNASPAGSQEHSRLLKALRESELLRELSELLASSLDPTGILQVLVKRTTEACDVQRCAVWLLDESCSRFLPSAYHLSTHHLKRKTVQAVDRMWHHSALPFQASIFQRLLQENGMLALEDLRREPSMSKIAEKFVVRSVLLVALVREDRPVGFMSLDNIGKITTFSHEQQQLARAIGQQAAVAIDNAHLYQQAQNERRRAERLIERAQCIYQVALAVNSGAELPSVLESASEHLFRGADAQSAAIALLEHEHLTLISATAANSPTPASERKTSPVITALPSCYAAATDGEQHYVRQDQLVETEKRWFGQLGMENVMIAPLMVGEQKRNGRAKSKKDSKAAQQCVGLAFVNYPQTLASPDQEQYTFVRDIAAQCALAIEKAHILSEARHAVALATERANTLDAVFNAMTEGIVVLDMEGQVILSNNTAAQFVSLTRNVKKHLPTYLKHNPAYTLYGHLIAVEDHPLMRALDGERIRGERFISKHRDGEEHSIEVNIVPLLDSDNRQMGIVAAFRDITEQIRVEQRIRRALDMMLHAAEAVSGISDIREISYRVLGMTLTALNSERGVVQLYNQEEQTFIPLLSIGFSLEGTEQWLAEQKYWLSPDDHHYAGIYAQLLEGHATLISAERSPQGSDTFSQTMILAAPITHNKRLLGIMMLDRSISGKRGALRQPGTTRPLAAVTFNAWDMAIAEGIVQFAGLAIEQTRWQQEAEIARTNEATMRESNALKDEFLAITAHEFRTPLTVVLAHSQMMARLLQKAKAKDVSPGLKSRLNESISFIEGQARQLTNIVNTFLEVTRLNRGQIALNQEEVNLEEIVKEAVAQHSATLTDHELRYKIEHYPHPYILLGDKARLLQIFANLLQNAIKYSPLGGPITIYLTQCPDAEGKRMSEVTVEDKGIGVPRDAQPYLFERFYRAPNIGGSQARGVGLGLYVVAEFLHLHGGTIRVESNGVEGEGSRFIFTLPLLERETSSNGRSS